MTKVFKCRNLYLIEFPTPLNNVAHGETFFLMLKSPTTYNEQLKIIRRRGCKILDEESCIKTLRKVNYYRLSGYFLPFKEHDIFEEDIFLENIFRIYEFDRKLRLVIFGAIEVIEIYVRTQLAYYHSHKYGPIGYLSQKNYNKKFNYQHFQSIIKKEIQQNKNVLFVQHYIQKDKGELPLWVMVELFSFGNLSCFYRGLLYPDQRKIADAAWPSYSHSKVSSWLKCCNDLRNLCAHSGRLYYRVFSNIPKDLDQNFTSQTERTLWDQLLSVKLLFPDTNQWNSEFLMELENLLSEYSDVIHLSHLGFPQNEWKKKLKK